MTYGTPFLGLQDPWRVPLLELHQPHPMKQNPKKTALEHWHTLLQKEIADYMKAKRGEIRKRPVYLEKDSDKAVDSMRQAFDWFVIKTYRD